MYGVIAICGVLFVLGLSLLILGLRGRWVGDHPHCRKCGFDLFGSPEPREKCGECGSNLSSKRAVVVGVRKRRWEMIGAGISFTLVPLLAGAGIWVGVAKNVQWYSYAPNWWVGWDMQSTSPSSYTAGYAECDRRLRIRVLTQRQAEPLIDGLLSLQARLLSSPTGVLGGGTLAVGPSRLNVSMLLSKCVVANQLSRQQLDRYEKAVFGAANVAVRGNAVRHHGFNAQVLIEPSRVAEIPISYEVVFVGAAKRSDDNLLPVNQRHGEQGIHLELSSRRPPHQLTLHPPAHTTNENTEHSASVDVIGELRLLRDGMIIHQRPIAVKHCVTWTQAWNVALLPEAEATTESVNAQLKQTLQASQVTLREVSGHVMRQTAMQWYSQRPLWNARFLLVGDAYLRCGDEERYLDVLAEGGNSRSSLMRGLPIMKLEKEATIVVRGNPLVAEALEATKPIWMGEASVVFPAIMLGDQESKIYAPATTAAASTNPGKLHGEHADNLLEMLRSPSDITRNDAVWEILRRLWEIELAGQKHDVRTHPLAWAAGALLDIQQEQTWVWNPQVGDALDLLEIQGALTKEHMARYLSQAAAKDAVVVRTLPTPRGRSLPIEIERMTPRLGRVVPRKVNPRLEYIINHQAHVIFDDRDCWMQIENNSHRTFHSLVLGEGGSSPEQIEQLRMASELEFRMSCNITDAAGELIGNSTTYFRQDLHRPDPVTVQRITDAATREAMEAALRLDEIDVEVSDYDSIATIIRLAAPQKNVKLPVGLHALVVVDFGEPNTKKAETISLSDLGGSRRLAGGQVTMATQFRGYPAFFAPPELAQFLKTSQLDWGRVVITPIEPLPPELDRVFAGKIVFENVRVVKHVK